MRHHDSHDSDVSDAEREAARLRAEAERAEAERRERRKVITLNKLGAAAIEVRRQFLTTLLARLVDCTRDPLSVGIRHLSRVSGCDREPGVGEALIDMPVEGA